VPPELELPAPRPGPKPVGHRVAQAEHSFVATADKQGIDGVQAPASAPIGQAHPKNPLQLLFTAAAWLEHELSRQLTHAAGEGSLGQFVTPYPPPSLPSLELPVLHATIAIAPAPTAESVKRMAKVDFIESS